MFNIRSVDLNLLPVLEAVYEERSLSRAAVRLAMTQSAVSHAVSRLRLVLRDELFVRHSRGVVPTPAAAAIYARLHGALSLMRESVTEARGFDPATSTRKFFLAIPHPLGPMIMLRLQNRLATAAPNLVVAGSTRSRPADLERALRAGHSDAAIDWLAPHGESFKSALLFDDALVAVARQGHPALRRQPSIRVLKSGKFVSLRPRVEGEHPVEAIRAWDHLGLQVTLEVSEILEVFMVVSQSDLFGLIPRSMEALARHVLGLRSLGVSPRSAAVPIRLYWHASRDREPAHVFLRKEIAAVTAKLIKHG